MAAPPPPSEKRCSVLSGTGTSLIRSGRAPSSSSQDPSTIQQQRYVYEAPKVPGSAEKSEMNIDLLQQSLMKWNDAVVCKREYNFDSVPACMWIVIEPKQKNRGYVKRAFEELLSNGCLVTAASLADFSKPQDPLNREQCSKADKDNGRKDMHNRTIANLISEMIKTNGCGTSAGRVTVPEKPEGFEENMNKEMVKTVGEGVDMVEKACAYLKQLGLIPMIDYSIKQCRQIADAVSFFAQISSKLKDMKKEGFIKIRSPCKPPSHWDGLTHQDNLGSPVKWGDGGSHCFITPDVMPIFKDACSPNAAISVFGPNTPEKRITKAYESCFNFGKTILLLSDDTKVKIANYCCGKDSLPLLLSGEMKHPLAAYVLSYDADSELAEFTIDQDPNYITVQTQQLRITDVSETQKQEQCEQQQQQQQIPVATTLVPANIPELQQMPVPRKQQQQPQHVSSPPRDTFVAVTAPAPSPAVFLSSHQKSASSREKNPIDDIDNIDVGSLSESHLRKIAKYAAMSQTAAAPTPTVSGGSIGTSVSEIKRRQSEMQSRYDKFTGGKEDMISSTPSHRYGGGSSSSFDTTYDAEAFVRELGVMSTPVVSVPPQSQHQEAVTDVCAMETEYDFGGSSGR